MGRNSFPSEEEQMQAYKLAIKKNEWKIYNNTNYGYRWR